MIQKADRLGSVKEYYFSKKLREVAALKNEGKPIINIAIGSPDLAPPTSVVEALKNTVQLPNAHMYQSYQGIPELREGICNFYNEKYNVALDMNTEVLPLMGSKEGIMHISMAFLNKGDKVLIPNPGYPTYASVTNLVQAEAVTYDLNEAGNWLPDFDALEKEDLENVKIMWVNYPHMPTGAVATKDNLTKLVAFAKKHNILIVNDNPYSFILHQNPLSILEIEGAKEVAIELNSLSKTFNMAGWRVGMVVGDAEIIKTILQVKSNMDSGMFLGIQRGAVEAFKLKNDWFESQNEIYKTRRDIVWRIFDALNCTYDTSIGGLFVWAKLPEGVKSEEITDDLLYNKNVFITPGTIFGSNGEGYIRASLCVEETVLNEVLNRFTTKTNTMKKLVVIGLGLIGGSLALDLKKRSSFKVFGIDQNPEHIKKSIELGVIDEEISFSNIVDADVVIVAVPVNIIGSLVSEVLDVVSDDTLVFDVGSVKNEICKDISNHQKRKNFVAAHPLAGTEFSGPEAAIYDLFDEKVNIICEADKSDWRILDNAISLFKLLNMRIKMMNPVEHDRHIAYVSHLSHVSSFMLGKTVLEIEKNEEAIFDMASTGFASTVRLAKSSANTWTPIFLENKENIIKSLDEYIKNLNEFKELIENNNTEALNETMNGTNYIKSILNGIKESN